MVFPILADIIAEETNGTYTFEHEDRYGYNSLILKKDGRIVMYDLCPRPIKETFRMNMENFHGDVLICGAGIGFCIFPIKDETRITSITVIEQSQEIIDMLSPYLPEVKFIKADALSYIPERLYNTIFLDIWESCTPSIQGVEERRYREYLTPDGFINYLDF